MANTDSRYSGAMTNYRRGLPPSMKEVRLSEDARQFDETQRRLDDDLELRSRIAELTAQIDRERLAETQRQFDLGREDSFRMEGLAAADAMQARGMAQANAALAQAQELAAPLQAASMRQAAARAAERQRMSALGQYADANADAIGALRGVGTFGADTDYARSTALARGLSSALGIQGGKMQTGATGILKGGFDRNDFIYSDAQAEEARRYADQRQLAEAANRRAEQEAALQRRAANMLIPAQMTQTRRRGL